MASLRRRSHRSVTVLPEDVVEGSNVLLETYFHEGGLLHPGDREYVYIDSPIAGAWRGVTGSFICREGGAANPNACTISAQSQQRDGNVVYDRVVTGTFEFVPDFEGSLA